MYQPSQHDTQPAAATPQGDITLRFTEAPTTPTRGRKRSYTAFRGMVFGALICTPFWLLLAYLLR